MMDCVLERSGACGKREKSNGVAAAYSVLWHEKILVVCGDGTIGCIGRGSGGPR